MTRTSSTMLSFRFSSSSLLFLIIAFTAIISQVNADDGQELEELPDSVRTKLLELKERGIAWLLNQRNNEFGWELGDTPRVVLALASSVKDWPAQHDLEARLTVKQLELELLEKLIRHNVDPLTPGRVSIYALALNGACKDPRNFYGHNLVASLEKHTADQDYPGYPEAFGYSLTAFVSCLSGSHLHRKQVRHLIQITSEIGSPIGSVDTRSMAAMALECFRRKRHNDALERHIEQALKKITQIQQPDGSFGNIHTTTVAIQALAIASEIPGLSWNRTAAAIVLSTMQRPDGSFLDSTHATTEAVIAATTLLNGIGLLNLKRGRCSDFIERPKSTTNNNYQLADVTMYGSQQQQQQQTSYTVIPANGQTLLLASNNANSGFTNSKNILHPNTESKVNETQKETGVNTITKNNRPLLTVSSPLGEMATIKYWIWIGPEPSTAEKYNLTLQVPVNETFFNVMRRAAELSPSFEFSATVWPNGHYVHTISGFREQPVGYHYWLLYRLPTEPDPASPPPTTFVAPAGVDNLKVQDGEIYLFWYKKL